MKWEFFKYLRKLYNYINYESIHRNLYISHNNLFKNINNYFSFEYLDQFVVVHILGIFVYWFPIESGHGKLPRNPKQSESSKSQSRNVLSRENSEHSSFRKTALMNCDQINTYSIYYKQIIWSNLILFLAKQTFFCFLFWSFRTRVKLWTIWYRHENSFELGDFLQN